MHHGVAAACPVAEGACHGGEFIEAPLKVAAGGAGESGADVADVNQLSSVGFVGAEDEGSECSGQGSGAGQLSGYDCGRGLAYRGFDPGVGAAPGLVGGVDPFGHDPFQVVLGRDGEEPVGVDAYPAWRHLNE